MPAISIALAFILSAWLTRYLSGSGFALAVPNERSLHDRPTPATGGLAILAAIAIGGAVACTLGGNGLVTWPLCLAALLLGGVSYVDDRFSVSPLYRLAAHLGAAWLVLGPGGLMPPQLVLPGGTPWEWPAWLGMVLCFGLVVWMINLYNFMDGMDGFAGGMAVFGFGAYAVLGVLQGAPAFALLNAVVAAAAAGFLVFNFPPARIFMGDSGATVLGLFAACAALWAEREQIFPLWVGILIFSPFIVDATLTLLRRALNREKVWQAHRTHCYQRLVRAGWGHRRTVLWEYALMAVCAVSAVLALYLPPAGQAVLAGGGMLAYAVLWAGVERLTAGVK